MLISPGPSPSSTPSPSPNHQDNRLLATLPRETLHLMRHDLRQVSLSQGQTVQEAGAPIDHIYFPQSGMI